MTSTLTTTATEIIWDAYEWRPVAEGPAPDAEERIQALEQAVERLMAANAAMWGLLRQRTGLADYDLLVKLRQEEVERQEARGVGRVNRTLKCARCARVGAARKGKCVYCGAAMG